MKRRLLVSKGLIIDPLKCLGCRACELACSMVKSGESGIYKSCIKNIRFFDDYFFYPNVCAQCETPYCAMVCPTSALSKNLDTGVVELVEDKCVGCKICLVACPFGAIHMVESTPIKCDLCDGDPVCVKFCRPEALVYGETEDIGAGRRVLVATPLLVDGLIRKVEKGKLVTVRQLRERLARDFGADSTCPLTTGIFIRIAAEVAEEDLGRGVTEVTPYWRVVRNDGGLNEKFPGGVDIQAARLKDEGHIIEPGKGKKPPKVKDFEKALT